ncbi:hypothetical protein [Solibacillus sp. FSL K6-1554]|uniref:hypothetical protein n=1 Tax=Solibacillus sp. FSL K6-1554 TaxID=2921472 RepID=UPI0030F6E4D1
MVVESVSAINAKTLEVTFNTEADVTAADFSVKKGSVTTNVSEVVIAEDKKSAKIELAAKLSEGEYTISVKVGEETLTGTVQAEDEKLDKIEILSDVAALVFDANTDDDGLDDEYSVKVGVQALNQYGEDITKTSTLKATASGAIVANSAADVTNNEVTVELKNSVKKDDTFVLTIVDETTGVVATKTVKVSDVAVVSTVEVGELYNKDGKTLSQDTNTTDDTFYLPVTLKDQYGNNVKNASADALVIAGVNTAIATVGALTTATIDGEETLVLPVTIAGNALAGTTPVNLVVAATGSSAQTSVTVAPGKSIATITLGAPSNEVVAEGESINFPLTVLDNEGNEIKTVKALKALKDGRGFDASTEDKITEKEGVLYYSTTAPANSLTVVVQTENGKVATRTVSVKAAAKVAAIVGLNAKDTTPLTTSFRSDDEAGKTFTTDSFVFQDQYGRTIKSDSSLLDNVKVEAENGITEDGKNPFVIDNDAGTITLNDADTVTALSDTITFKVLVDDVEVKGSEFEQKFTIADVSTFIEGSFTVEPLKTVYVTTEGYTVVGDRYATDAPVVKGKTKAGDVVTLKASEYSVAKPTLNENFFKDAEGKVVTEKSAEIVVTINETGEKITVPVTYSTAASKVQTVAAYEVGTKKATTKATIEGDTVNLADVLAAVDVKTKDQYGVESNALDAADAVTFQKVTGDATFTNNGTDEATVTEAEDGAVVRAIIEVDGKTVTVELTFEAAEVSGEEPGTEEPTEVTPFELTVSSSVTAQEIGTEVYTVTKAGTTATVEADGEGELVITFANTGSGQTEAAVTEADLGSEFTLTLSDDTSYTVTKVGSTWTLTKTL